jgi:hypothetical protein
MPNAAFNHALCFEQVFQVHLDLPKVECDGRSLPVSRPWTTVDHDQLRIRGIFHDIT